MENGRSIGCHKARGPSPNSISLQYQLKNNRFFGFEDFHLCYELPRMKSSRLWKRKSCEGVVFDGKFAIKFISWLAALAAMTYNSRTRKAIKVKLEKIG